MGDEQGDRPPPFLVDWIDGPSTHHSDQLEVGRYSSRDFKRDPTSREQLFVSPSVIQVCGLFH